MRQVERAIFDLRRGLPVLIRDTHDNTAGLVAPLEGLNDATLTELAAATGNTPALLVTRHRLARMGCEIATPAARLLPGTGDDAAALVRWACASDAKIQADRVDTGASAIDAAALTLMRRGLLVPAALCAPIDPGHRAAIAARVADHSLLAVERADIQAYEQAAPALLKRVSEAAVPLAEAEQSRFVVFREADGVREHVAILISDAKSWPQTVPVRLHSACLTGDLFASLRCDCGEQLRASVAAIAARGGGVLLYLAQEGRGIGLANKMRAYHLQDQGLDTVDADQVLGFGNDERDYHIALEMLAQLGVEHIDLLTNNPAKLEAMHDGGVTVDHRRAIYGRLTRQNERYLTAKAQRAGHWLDALLGNEREERGAP